MSTRTTKFKAILTILLLSISIKTNGTEASEEASNTCKDGFCAYCNKLGNKKFCEKCYFYPILGTGTARRCSS